MSVVVKIPTPLRRHTGGADSINTDSKTLAQALAALNDQFPGIRERLLNDSGQLHRFVNVYVNGEDVRFLKGLETALKEGDEVSIVPAVAGG
ncbi:MAG: MoaD/ThiS family protein [Chloroflexi bacterium]|nr:MoaD/ThiS family protein [Chloroflexota bacterium]